MNLRKFGYTFVLGLMVAVIALAAFAPAAMAAGKDQPEKHGKPGKPGKPVNSVVDVALKINAETGEFSILIAALQAADPKIIKKLDGRGQFTVFAPTDAAFLALLEELGVSADELLGNRPLLNQVLMYHVAKGSRDSAQVLASDRIRTLQGGFLYQSGGVLTDANGRMSNIIAVDVKADNGYIHVIDRVVLP